MPETPKPTPPTDRQPQQPAHPTEPGGTVGALQQKGLKRAKPLIDETDKPGAPR